MDQLGDCEPIKRIRDLAPDQRKDVNGRQFTEEELDQPAIPCGLVAKSVFNDEYKLADSEGNSIDINSTDISWNSDRDYKFKNTEGNW